MYPVVGVSLSSVTGDWTESAEVVNLAVSMSRAGMSASSLTWAATVNSEWLEVCV